MKTNPIAMQSMKKLAGLLLTVLAVLSAPAQSTYVYQEYGKYGFCYQGTSFVLPQYEDAAAFDARLCYFAAKQGGKWGVVDAGNRVVAPFVYDDICLCTRIWGEEVTTRVLDSIYVYGRGAVLPRVAYEVNVRHEWKSANPNSIAPLLPVKKGGKWGYIDYKGNEVIDFVYDDAYMFWNCNTGKESLWLAHVKKGGKWGCIDIYGTQVVACIFDSYAPRKESETAVKDFFKRNRKDLKKMKQMGVDYEGSRMEKLAAQVMRELAPFAPYVPTYTGEVSVEKRVTYPNKKNKKVKNTTYRLQAADGSPVTDEEFDRVYDREGDVYRVVQGGRTGVVNLHTAGMMYPCVYDSISAFDACGFANAYSQGVTQRISLYNTCENYYPNLDAAFQEAKAVPYTTENYVAKATPLYDRVVAMLAAIDNPSIRAAYNEPLRSFYYTKRCQEDPVLQAELAARAAAREQEEASTSFWSVLGGLAQVAGGVAQAVGAVKGTGSATGEALESLGKTLVAIDDPEVAAELERERQAGGGGAADYYQAAVASNDVGVMQSRIAAIDRRIQAIGTEQASLARERMSAKDRVAISGAAASRVQTGSNLVRNSSSARHKAQAQVRAKAQQPHRSAMSDIDARLKRLNDEKSALLAERKQLNAQIASAEERAETQAEESSSNSRLKELSKETGDKAKYAKFVANNKRNYQSQVDNYEKILRDRIENPDNYLKRGESVADCNRKIRELRQKIKGIMDEYKRLSGGTDTLHRSESLY